MRIKVIKQDESLSYMVGGKEVVRVTYPNIFSQCYKALTHNNIRLTLERGETACKKAAEDYLRGYYGRVTIEY